MILMTIIYAVIWVVAVVLLYGMVNRGQAMQADLAALEQRFNTTGNQPATNNAEQVSS